METLLLGIDGGQSATKAAVGDSDGRVLGRGRAGPCNHVGAAEGREKLIAAIRGALEAALADANLPLSTHFAAACCGMSGGPADKEGILCEIIPADRLDVTTDIHIALVGGTGGRPGAAVIAGTGSIALAADAAGRTARAGGWGYLFGDEGGAFDIVRQALRAALRGEEGWGPPTKLRQKLLTAGSAADINELMHLFYTAAWPRSRVAALAPLAEEAAVEGDAVAAAILDDAGAALARYARAARDQLFGPVEVVPVCFFGGVFESERVRERFRWSVESAGGARVQRPELPAEEGALLKARRLVESTR